MNIYTFKLTRRRLVAAVLAAAVLIILIIIALPGRRGRAEQTSNAVSVSTEDECLEYIRSLGYETDELVGKKQVVIPDEFSEVYQSYNEMQKQCGFDLEKYKGRQALLRTYTVTNYGEEGILLDLLICKNKVIGGAVYTADVNGFMHGLIPNPAAKS